MNTLVAVTVVAVVIWLLAVLGMVARVRVMVKPGVSHLVNDTGTRRAGHRGEGVQL